MPWSSSGISGGGFSMMDPSGGVGGFMPSGCLVKPSFNLAVCSSRTSASLAENEKREREKFDLVGEVLATLRGKWCASSCSSDSSSTVAGRAE